MISKKFENILLTNVENKDLSYKELQWFSARFDEKLGFNIESVEKSLIDKAKKQFPQGNQRSWGKSLYNGSETWIGLNPDQLQTTYGELYEALKFINPKKEQIFCDLGAGYGRLGILIGLLFKKVRFIGVEIVEQRVLEGNRVFDCLSLSQSELINGTLGKIPLPFADYYFLYDFGSVVEINAVLELISKNLRDGPVTIIARGRGVRSIINNKHHWLSIVYQSRLDSFVIYSTSPK
jgi:hypothetical protein